MDEININSFSEEKECIFEGEIILFVTMELYFDIQKKILVNEKMIMFGLLEKKIVKIHIYYFQEFAYIELLQQLF